MQNRTRKERGNEFVESDRDDTVSAMKTNGWRRADVTERGAKQRTVKACKDQPMKANEEE